MINRWKGRFSTHLAPQRWMGLCVIGVLLALPWLSRPDMQTASAGLTLAVSAEDFSIHFPLVMRNHPLVLPPPVLNVISNADGDGDYTVTWSTSPGATTYTLEEADDADFAMPNTVYTGAETSTQLSDRWTGTNFYRVRASNTEGASSWSNVQSVQVTSSPTCPATGQWSGTTNQGPTSIVTFEVQNTPYCRIPESELGVNPQFGFLIRFWDSCGTERNIVNGDEIPIVDGRFELLDTDGTYRGEFTSTTTTSGTFAYNNGSCWASGTWTAKLPPPGAFSKTSPSNGATVRPPSVTLSWGASAQADSYAYCYDTTNDGACSTWVSTGATRTATIEGLSPSTTFYWQVRAVNNAGSTYANDDATAFWSFTTNSGAPGDFVKLSPTDGATDRRPNSLTLDWGSSSYAESYAYCYDTTDDDACTSWVETGTASQALVTGLPANATIYWQVRATNSYGDAYANGDATAYWSFGTGNGLPGAFSKVSPANGATNLPANNLTLDWGNSSYVESYAYCIDTTDDDACTTWIDAGATSQVTLNGLEDLTRHHWQVRASNSYGATYANGDATAYWSFSTRNELTGVWSQQTAGATWAARNAHSAVVLPDGSLVLMGGSDGTQRLNDVWRSTDQGTTWTPQTAAAAWAARSGHSTVALPDGSVVLMGGQDGNTHLNDVWRSTDQGASWTQVTAAAAWAGRVAHATVLTGSEIILMGGLSSGPTLWNDVWRSTDQGATWTLQVNHAPWAARFGHATVALPDGSLVLMGGFGVDSTASYRRDVWRSTDQGLSWTLVLASAPWAARQCHTSVVLPDGSIVLMGGYASTGYRNDVWRTKDYGATWVQLTGAAPWTARTEHTSVTLPDGSIVLMGGVGSAGRLNDVWRFVKDD